MPTRLAWIVCGLFVLAMVVPGCSDNGPAEVAAQPGSGGPSDASVSPPPPAASADAASSASPSTTTQWLPAPVSPTDPVAPVSTALPPGFVEVTPPAPPAPESPATAGDSSEAKPAPAAPNTEPKAGESSPPPTPSPADEGETVSPSIAAFIAANRATVDSFDEVQETLASVTDDPSARQAAEKLPQVTDRFIQKSKGATAIYLALPENRKKEALRHYQEEVIRQMLKGTDKPSGRPDLIQLCVDIAQSPQRAIMHDALVAMRDVMLDQHSIYVPVRTREEIAKRLGAKGSPLPQ